MTAIVEKWKKIVIKPTFLKNSLFFSDNLVDWFQKNGRDLPWRNTREPYFILLSELMLQQTQVDRVIAFYHDFIKKFPNFKAVADAEEQDIIDAWGGLGYYNRARNLQKTAKIIISDYNGEFPKTKKEILDLPGIGKYTAGAVMTFALELREALVDTNVDRVYSRVFIHPQKIANPRELEKVLWIIAEAVIPEKKYWEFNQGIMDFGAIHCRIEKPKCQTCPMKSICKFYKKRSLTRFL
jgi:A/G-specific adenine glycosylase